jgi:hypothetical protein
MRDDAFFPSLEMTESPEIRRNPTNQGCIPGVGVDILCPCID